MTTRAPGPAGAHVPKIGARVPEHVQRRAKMRAAAKGITIGEYITNLILKDTEDIAHFIEKESLNGTE
jgi:predicted DNA binding CopG/RHH family protein